MAQQPQPTMTSRGFATQLAIASLVLGFIALVDFLFFLYIFITMIPSYVYFLSTTISPMSAVAARNAILFNAAGMMPWAPHAINLKSNHMDKLLLLLTNWWIFAATWGVTILMIASTYLASYVSKMVAMRDVQREVKKIRDEQQDLIDEWGVEVVSGGAMIGSPVSVVPVGGGAQS
ncbi:MAG: hypothetical protein FJX47_04340 [Alphaproteobacteria bacterium]|nr:hypothetical protein [Alphaproteobacteria bacterium]